MATRAYVVQALHDNMTSVMFHLTDALGATDNEVLSSVATILGRILGASMSIGVPPEAVEETFNRIRKFAQAEVERIKALDEGKGQTRQ